MTAGACWGILGGVPHTGAKMSGDIYTNQIVKNSQHITAVARQEVALAEAVAKTDNMT